MMFYRKKTNGGFTLIELLVVIAIIAVLSRVVLIATAAAKAKARDAWRKSQLVQLQNALALYYAKNGSYPISQDLYSTAMNSNNPTFTGRGTGANGYIPGLVPSFMSALPLDPKTTADKVGFAYTTLTANPAKHYKILLVDTPESFPDSKFYDPGSPSGEVWMITDKYELPPPAISGSDPNDSPEQICSHAMFEYYNNSKTWPLDWPICW